MKINRIHSHRFQLKFRFAAQTAGDRPDPVDRQRLCDDVLYFHPRIQAGVGVLKNQLSAALEGFFLRGELFFITDVSTVVEDLLRGFGCRRFMTQRASVVFPEPDSPTRPKISPRRI